MMAAVARPSPSRISARRILLDLRLAARKGDRTALSLALDQMRTLANSPRYWERYLDLLRNPLARLVDLLVIKQGDRIARQKGWKLPRPAPTPAQGARPPAASGPVRRRPAFALRLTPARLTARRRGAYYPQGV
jgi:hypothetical protein